MAASAALDLARFVALLRAAGVRVDTRQYLAANELLLALAAAGLRLEDDAAALASHLGPIFCTTPDEQQRFGQLTADWVAASRGDVAAQPDVAQRPRAWSAFFARRNTLVTVGVVAVLLLALGAWRVRASRPVARPARVLTVEQRPLEGATVSAGEQRVVTDANGLCLLLLQAGGSLQVKAEADGYTSKTGTLRAADIAPVDLVLERVAPQAAPVKPAPVPDAGVATPLEDVISPPIEAPKPQAFYILQASWAAFEVKQPRPSPWRLRTVGVGLAWFVVTLLAWAVGSSLRRRLVLRRLPSEGRHDWVDLPGPPLPAPDERDDRFLVAGLRRTRAEASVELDAVASAEASARMGGYPTAVLAQRRSVPEYLVLSESLGGADHQARLTGELVDRLTAMGLRADRYVFNGDPRMCSEPGSLRAMHTLGELVARHQGATLLLFLDAARCFDALTGQLAPWVEALGALPRRVVLTPDAPFHWTTRERALADAGWVVLPGGVEGLRLLAALEGSWHLEQLFPAPYARPYPRALAQGEARWLEPTPPSAARLAQLVEQLHGYLGAGNFEWLASCAVCPQLAWPLTLSLAPPGVDVSEGLWTLSRLPWFREGFMPDWLRRALISQLSEVRERAVRAELLTRLEQQAKAALAGRGGDADGLTLASWLGPLDVIRSEPADSALRDAVFVGFVAGARLDSPELEAPGVVARLFRRLGVLPTRRVAGVAREQRSWWRGLVAGLRGLATFRPWVARVFVAMLVAVVGTLAVLRGEAVLRAGADRLVLHDVKQPAQKDEWELTGDRLAASHDEVALKAWEAEDRRRRLDNIAEQEALLARTPNDAVRTPIALFRLGAYEFERSSDDFNLAYELYNASLERVAASGAAPPAEPKADFSRALATWRRLLKAFPAWEHADAVKYLVGYVLEKEDASADAAKAWHRLIDEHPESPLVTEAWLRVGEYEFDAAQNAPRSPYAHLYAVVIGIDRYRTPQFSLRGAVADAQRVASTLRAQGFDVTLVTDEAATLAALTQLLQQQLPARLQPDDGVLVYFAGMGIPTPGGALLPVNVDPAQAGETTLEFTTLQSWFKGYAAKHVVLVADAQLGDLVLDSNAASLEDSGAHPRAGQRALRLTLAARTSSDGDSAFTREFLSAIEGTADTNHDGVVTSAEVVTRLTQQGAKPIVGRRGEGEFFFVPHGSMAGLAKARIAYENASRDQTHPMYDKALYKLGWTQYLQGQFDDAAGTFVRLLEFMDARPSQLADFKTEALQYLALSFAEHPADALKRARALVGGRPFAADAYRTLGDLMLDAGHSEEAIAAYEAVLETDPLLKAAPQVLRGIVTAYERSRRFDEVEAQRARLATLMSPGTPWYERWKGESEVLKAADDLAQRTLIQTATAYHQHAIASRQDKAFDRAKLEFELAARAYRTLLTRFPTAEPSYDWAFYEAECLFNAFQFELAAQGFEGTRDDTRDQRFQLDSAYSAVVAWSKALDLAYDEGKLAGLPLRSAADRRGQPVQASPLAQLEQRMVAASDRYLELAPVDEQKVPAVAYRAAELLYRHDQFTQARGRLEALIARAPKAEPIGYAVELAAQTWLIEGDLAGLRVFVERMLATPDVVFQRPGLRVKLEAWRSAKTPPATALPEGLDSGGAPASVQPAYVEPKTGLTWAKLPRGRFRPGCVPGDVQCQADEEQGTGLRAVQAFALMTTEVTAGAYEACRAAGGCSPPNPGGNCNAPQKAEHPVNCVDHAQARAFCLWVGGRLPTAVEWEYAAKSGQAVIYAWGNGAPTQELANFGQAYASARGTDAVGSHPAGNTPWGLKDMNGNVWEWTASRYDAKTIEVRGGGWVYGPTYQRSSYRNALEPGTRADYLGFRCAR